MALDLERQDTERGREVSDHEEGDQESRKRKTFKDRLYASPKNITKRRCPIIWSWLETLQYDHALVIQDKTHFCIYLSVFITFFFSAMWLVDVFTLNCANPRPGDEDIGGDNVIGETWKCIMELLGGLIFFGGLMDSIVMLGNYDNDAQSLKREKERKTEEVKTDIKEALGKAKKNAEDLMGILLKISRDNIGQLVEDTKPVFVSMISVLLDRRKIKDDRERQDNEKIIKCLEVRLGEVLGDIGQLAEEFSRKLQNVYTRFNEYMEKFNETGIKAENIAGENPPLFWRVYIAGIEGFPHNAPLPDGANQNASISASEAARQGNVRKVSPGIEAMKPIENITANLDKLTKHNLLFQRSEEFGSPEDDKLMGFGSRLPNGLWSPAPPWGLESDGSRFFECHLVYNKKRYCCVPRLCSFILLWVCCCRCFPCCGRNPEKGGRCNLRRSNVGYPKRVRIGPFWFQVISRMHERLISGLVFTSMFALFYAWRIFLQRWHCNDNVLYGDWWSCFLLQVKRHCLLLALLFHLPANFLCLVKIRDLDKVIEIMEDIRKFQGMRAIIQEFSKDLEVQQEQGKLVDAINERVFLRMKVVSKLKTTVRDFETRAKQKGTPGELNDKQLRIKMLDATKEAIMYLEWAAEKKLSSPKKWFFMKSADQKKQVAKIVKAQDMLEHNGFKGGSMQSWIARDEDQERLERLEKEQEEARNPGVRPREASSPPSDTSLPTLPNSSLIETHQPSQSSESSRPMTPPLRPGTPPLAPKQTPLLPKS